MQGPRETTVGTRVFGALALFVPLLVYVWTLAPTVTLEDSGEFITVARYLGVAHPPGYPLWCLVAHAFTWLPLGDVAQRVHLCSAVFAALTAWVVYLVVLRLTRRPPAALVAALALGFSQVLWSQAVVAEVYTLNSFLTILAVYWIVRWREARQGPWLQLLALTVGLGLANHHLLALVAPALLGWVLAVDWRRAVDARTLVAGGLLLLAGLSLYVYLPLRATSDPPVNIGRTNTLAGVFAHITRASYRDEDPGTSVTAEPRERAQHTLAAWRGSAEALGWPLALVALAGAVSLARRQRDVFWMSLGVILLNTAVLNALVPGRFNATSVFAQRVYYIPAQVMLALWLGAGCRALLDRAADRGPLARHVAHALLAAGLLMTLVLSYPAAHRQGDRRARDFALDLLDSAPPGAGFLAVDDEVVFPLTYMKYVEGVRPDVHVLALELGWKREPPTAVLSAQPLSDALATEAPELAQFRAVPHGLAYWLVRRDEHPPPGYRAFTPLPSPPRDSQLESFGDDVESDWLKAIYAAYYARLGAFHAVGGRSQAASEAFVRAEALNPADPFVSVLLVDIYRDMGLHRERWVSMLEEALASYDQKLDPSVDRYYPLRREEIEERLRSLGARG
jgi:hypothetical protein